MTRLNLVLLLAVVLSALYLVNVQYQSRWLYAELDKAQSQAKRIAADNERLQVEKRAQATSARVEQLAKGKLQMRAASPGVTTYVAYANANPASAAITAAERNSFSGRLP
jgi:cell division protein FtsL